MAAAFIMAQLYAYYALSVTAMAMIMATVYTVASSAQQRSQMASKREQAIQSYYNQLAEGKTKSQAFSSSRASYRSIRAQAAKYSSISEQLVGEAAAREKYSLEQRAKEGKYRDLKARQVSFGNNYSARRSMFGLPEGTQDKTDILLARSDFGSLPDAFESKINVEIFNTNFFGEA